MTVSLFNKEFPVLQTGTVKLRYSGRNPCELPPVWGPELVFIAKPIPVSQIKAVKQPKARIKIAHYKIFLDDNEVICMQLDQPLDLYEFTLPYFVKDDCQVKKHNCTWGPWIYCGMDKNHPIISLGHKSDGNSIATRIKTLKKIGVIE